MIEKLTYDEVLAFSKKLNSSSKTIREIMNHYEEDLKEIEDFCDSLDTYISFLDSSVNLYKDSDKALEFIMNKNK